MARRVERIALILAAAGCLAAAPAPSGKPAAGPGTEPGGLKVELSLGSKELAPGGVVKVKARLRNAGNKPLRILEDLTFVGSELRITGPSGEVASDHGFLAFSPKVGIYPGRSVLLPPGGSHEVAFEMFLDEDYRLLCGGGAPSTPDEVREAREREHLSAAVPDRFVGAGRIFPVGKAGTLRVVFRYERVEQDKRFTLTGGTTEAERSTDGLWVGTAESSPVEFVLR